MSKPCFQYEQQQHKIIIMTCSFFVLDYSNMFDNLIKAFINVQKVTFRYKHKVILCASNMAG